MLRFFLSLSLVLTFSFNSIAAKPSKFPPEPTAMDLLLRAPAIILTGSAFYAGLFSSAALKILFAKAKPVQERASTTAESVCLFRDFYANANGLSSDNMAHLFLSSYEHLLSRMFGWYYNLCGSTLLQSRGMGGVVARGNHGDEILRDFLAWHGSQNVNVVLLGAGYETRFYRLGLEKNITAHFYEVDIASTAAKKKYGLRNIERKHVHYAYCDFSKETFMDALSKKMFDPSLPTLFMWEGVSMYLSKGDVEATLKEVAAHPNYEIYFDVMSQPDRLLEWMVARVGEPYKFYMDIDKAKIISWLDGLGLDLAGFLDKESMEERYFMRSNLSKVATVPEYFGLIHARSRK